MGQLDAAMGAIATLGTVDKTSLVAAINEVLVTAYTEIGSLGSLTTANQTSLVAALNELRAQTITYGIYVSAAQLIAWTESEAYELTGATIDATYGIVSSGTVKWPDGSGGAFTATTINATFAAIDAYTITHTVSSHTVTQAAVTRNANGAVTVKPALVVT